MTAGNSPVRAPSAPSLGGTMLRPVAILATILGVAAAGYAAFPRSGGEAVAQSSAAGEGIHKIKHVVIIMQENRSFDTYFGTFPGADGIPMQQWPSRRPVTRIRLRLQCVQAVSRYLRLSTWAARTVTETRWVPDLDGGKMDGFLGADACR